MSPNWNSLAIYFFLVCNSPFNDEYTVRRRKSMKLLVGGFRGQPSSGIITPSLILMGRTGHLVPYRCKERMRNMVCLCFKEEKETGWQTGTNVSTMHRYYYYPCVLAKQIKTSEDLIPKTMWLDTQYLKTIKMRI